MDDPEYDYYEHHQIGGFLLFFNVWHIHIVEYVRVFLKNPQRVDRFLSLECKPHNQVALGIPGTGRGGGGGHVACQAVLKSGWMKLEQFDV